MGVVELHAALNLRMDPAVTDEAWRTAELVSTEAGQARLAAWDALARPPLARRAIDRDLVALGFGGARPRIVEAVRALPAPVALFTLHHVWIMAFLGEPVATRLPSLRPSELYLVVLDPRPRREVWLPQLALHIARLWLRPRVLPRRRRQWSASEIPFAQTAEDPLTVALARSWGFSYTTARTGSVSA